MESSPIATVPPKRNGALNGMRHLSSEIISSYAKEMAWGRTQAMNAII